jgi:voltage-gated sodium channel
MSGAQDEADVEADVESAGSPSLPHSPAIADAEAKPFLVALVTHRAWGAVFLWVIMANTVTMAMMRPTEPADSPWNHRLEVIETVFLFVFTAELVVKLAALRMNFFDDGWNNLDIIIVSTGYLVFLPGDTINTSVFRTVRVLRPLRSIGMMPGVRILIDALIMSLPGLGTLLVRSPSLA